jgi:hypothetical protein
LTPTQYFKDLEPGLQEIAANLITFGTLFDGQPNLEKEEYKNCRICLMENVVNCIYAKKKRKDDEILSLNSPEYTISNLHGSREDFLEYYHRSANLPDGTPPRRLPASPVQFPRAILPPGQKLLEPGDGIIPTMPGLAVSPGGSVNAPGGPLPSRTPGNNFTETEES